MKVASSIHDSKNIYERMAKRKLHLHPASWRFPFNPPKFARLTIYVYRGPLELCFNPVPPLLRNCAWWKKGLRDSVSKRIWGPSRQFQNLRARTMSKVSNLFLAGTNKSYLESFFFLSFFPRLFVGYNRHVRHVYHFWSEQRARRWKIAEWKSLWRVSWTSLLYFLPSRDAFLIRA